MLVNIIKNKIIFTLNYCSYKKKPKNWLPRDCTLLKTVALIYLDYKKPDLTIIKHYKPKSEYYRKKLSHNKALSVLKTILKKDISLFRKNKTVKLTAESQKNTVISTKNSNNKNKPKSEITERIPQKKKSKIYKSSVSTELINII